MRADRRYNCNYLTIEHDALTKIIVCCTFLQGLQTHCAALQLRNTQAIIREAIATSGHFSQKVRYELYP